MSRTMSASLRTSSGSVVVARLIGPPSCFPLLQLVHDSFRVRYAIFRQIQKELWHGLSVGMSIAFPVGTLNDAPAKLLAEAVASQGNFLRIPRVLSGSELLHQPYYLKLDQVVLVMTSLCWSLGASFRSDVTSHALRMQHPPAHTHTQCIAAPANCEPTMSTFPSIVPSPTPPPAGAEVQD